MSKMKLNNWQPVENLKPMAKLLAAGEADFTIKAVYDKDKNGDPLVSQKNDPMINLQFTVIDKDGTQGTMYEYFTPNTLWKIHNLCEAIGRPELYQPDFDYGQIIGMTGKLNIQVDERPGYPKRNSIKNYIKYKTSKAGKYATEEQMKALESDLSIMDSDLPF